MIREKILLRLIIESDDDDTRAAALISSSRHEQNKIGITMRHYDTPAIAIERARHYYFARE